jgi:beta-glucanase (GH16 family)
MVKCTFRIVLLLLCCVGVLPAGAGGGYAQKTGRVVWKETFSHAGERAPADASVWSYDEGAGLWGNGELETYCAYGSDKPPCEKSQPNSYADKDGLHILARKTGDGHYTSARLISRGRKDFKYGRIEARIRIPAGQGLWPAFWMMGADIETVQWPACGEIDVMENIGREPLLIHGTLHGPGVPQVGVTGSTGLPGDAPFAGAFHNYGVIWSPEKIAFYVDDPGKPYAVFTPRDLAAGAVWPFDGRSFYLLLNLAVGGEWPGPPDDTTHFPAEMIVTSITAWELR